MDEEPIVKSPDTLREKRIPPGQKLRKDWPVLHYGNIPSIDLSKWRFRIFGAVDKEIDLDFELFASQPHIKVHSDVHCVTGWSRLDNLWEGPGASTIYSMAQAKPAAKFVIVHAYGGFSTNLSLKDFLEPDVLFAIKHDDKPLTSEHGYPVRLVVPRLYFWKSAKWVTGIELSENDRPGFWESNGYHNHGDPWQEERYRNFVG
jgi:DMSO/TMAO reductase YedYZ molybdopterin-dependent catalytic subunit